MDTRFRSRPNPQKLWHRGRLTRCLMGRNEGKLLTLSPCPNELGHAWPVDRSQISSRTSDARVTV